MEDLEQLLTKEQVSELLGVKEYWIQREVRAGRLQCVRLGSKKLMRFRQSHIQQYLADREAQS